MPGRAQEVVGDGGAGQPGTVGPEPARGQVSQGTIDEIGIDLLDDGVAAVLGLGLFEDERGVGEHRVVAILREQLTLAGNLRRVQALDPRPRS